MEYFEQKLEQVKQREELPSWVSESNASYKAWKATEKKKGERIIYIKIHSKESHYKLKGSYQITGSEVAREAGIGKVTLLSTSAYSKSFKTYLKSVNEELELLKNARLEKAKKSQNRGLAGKTKKEVIAHAGSYKDKYESLLKSNTVEQVEQAINMLHPDVAAILIVKQAEPKGNVTHIGSGKRKQ